jgi:predicted transposase/invertase (TIGR01784 family)
MSKVNNPHDHFFREVMSQTDLAAEFLSLYLPPEVAALLDFSSLTTCQDGFIDEDLEEHLSDLLYRVRAKTGADAFLHLLLEHKSWPEKWVNLQILRYKTLFWHNLQRSGAKTLPYIIPVICYHGRRPWRVPPNFSALFGPQRGLEALQPYALEFRHHLCDLTRYDDEDLTGNPALQTVLRLLKYAFRESDLRRELIPIWRLAQTSDFPQLRFDSFVEVCSKYLEKGARLPKNEIINAYNTAVKETGGANMEGFFESWRKDGLRVGKQEGLQLGRQEGRQEGERGKALEIARKFLEKRFGPLAQDNLERLDKLTVGELDELNLAIFDFAGPDDFHEWLKQHASTDLLN